MRELLYTKFEAWKYENEYRVAARLVEADNGMFFRDFDDHISLHRVVVGARCSAKRKEIDAAVRPYGPAVEVIKARLAFRSFNVVRNKAGTPR